MNFEAITIQDVEVACKQIVVEMRKENAYIVLVLINGIRLKFKEWKTEYAR